MGKFKNEQIEKMNAMEKRQVDLDKQDIIYEAFAQSKVPIHKFLASKKLWITRNGIALYYDEMETSHIENCIRMFEEGLLEDRLYALRTLKQELLSRQSAAGKVLYANSK